uniref:PGG domain-containing protein n=1 Tax=Leersia perrieri TaxID=77586 RepID=A0A0D9XCX9_9ORYZ
MARDPLNSRRYAWIHSVILHLTPYHEGMIRIVVDPLKPKIIVDPQKPPTAESYTSPHKAEGDDQNSSGSYETVPRQNSPPRQLADTQGSTNGGTDQSDDNASIINAVLRENYLLHLVAESGDNEDYKKCATVILKKDFELISALDNKNETALDRATRAGHIKMASHLIHIALGTSVDVKKEMFSLHLMNHGRELSQKGENIIQMSPLYLAVSMGYSDIVDKLILTFGNTLPHYGPEGQNVLHAAAIRSVGDLYKSSPLHFAASVGVEGVTKLLIASLKKQKVEQQPDNEGMYPIHIASSVGAMDAINSLIDIDNLSSAAQGNSEGKTFLHIAVENRKRDVVEFVCREPRAKFLGILMGRVRPRQIFKDIVNMKDKDGNTALHLAVKKRDRTMFSYLLGNKYVELNYVNNEGYTPLDLASKIKTDHPFASRQNPTEWMIRALAHSGAHFSPQKQTHGDSLSRSTESVLVASVLIASLTFAAAFTMPGSYKTRSPKEGTPALGERFAFKAFLVADMFAFFFAVAATFSLAEYGTRGNVDPLSIIVAFALGVSVVMWDISVSATVIVGVLTSIFVLYGHVAIGHDLRLLRVMYHRFGLSFSCRLHPSTSAHLAWKSWWHKSIVVALLWDLVKLLWAYAFIYGLAKVAQGKQKE